MMNITETVKQLIIINIIFFVGTQLVGENAFNLLSAHYPENPNFHFWQVITHIFMHGGFMHLFSNMLGLLFFGPALESRWGGKKFLFFYISCGIGAFLVQQGIHYYYYHDSLTQLAQLGFAKEQVMDLLNKGMIDRRWQEVLSPIEFNNLQGNFFSLSLGASGAIYGILVAFAFLFPNIEMMMLFLPIPIKAKYFVSGIIAVDLFLGLRGQSLFGSVGGVAHFAHLGGALIGFLMMWYWKKDQFKNNRWN